MKASNSDISVLIVEDHGVTLAGLISGLANEPGIQVVGEAGTSDAGLALAKALNPQVILLDLHLPGSGGPRTNVKVFSELPGSKVVIFSGESRQPFISAVLNAGAAAYLLKSEGIPKIAQTIRAVASGKNVAPEALMASPVKVTKSEQEVLKMLARGMKYDEIAERRTSSPATVRKQCELLLEKLGLDSRERLIAWAVENGYGKLELDA